MTVTAAAPTQVSDANTGWIPARGAVTAVQDRRTVPYNLLFPSPLNPRKHFDDDEIQGLAQTIAIEGVMQNLTVRPGYLPGSESLQKDGPAAEGRKEGYEIAAGERRFRAIGWLIANGHAQPDYPVPVFVRDMSDEELVTLAMIENLDRDDLLDLELARGFAVMAKTMSTDVIASRVGKSPRFVQQRLNLITKAAPEVLAALDSGKITFSQARGAVFASPREQAKIVKEIAANPELTEKAVKIRAIGGLPNVSAAFFDRKRYTAEIVRDDDTGAEYFSDIALFAKLQRKAVEERAEELKAEGVPSVWVFDYAKKQFFNETQYVVKKGHAKAGAVLEIRINHHVVIHRDIVPLAELQKESPRAKSANTGSTATAAKAAGKTNGNAAKAAPAEKIDPLDSFTAAHRVHAHMRKTAALQIALMDNPLMAKRLLCFTLMVAGADYADHEEITRIHIATHARLGFKDVEHEGVAQVQDSLSKLLPANAHKALKMSPAELWKLFAGLDEKKTDRLLAALVAEQCGTWCGYATPIDDAELTVAVAHSLKIHINSTKYKMGCEIGDLEGLRKPALLAVARELKVPEAHEGMSADQLRDVCTHRLKKIEHPFVLPTLAFLTGDDMDKACRDFVEPPKAETKVAAKPTAKATPAPKATPPKPAKAKAKKPAKKK